MATFCETVTHFSFSQLTTTARGHYLSTMLQLGTVQRTLAWDHLPLLPMRPNQIRVAQLGPAQAFDLAGTGHRAFDQPAVGQEILHRGEAMDVPDLVEDGQAQVFADAGHRLQQRILPRGDLL